MKIGADGRPNGVMKTYSGRHINPLAMTVEDVDIEDIFWALPNLCRFGGHSNEFYSVAQHSVLVANTIWERTNSYDDAFWGLMHDASEAFLVDMPNPIKQDPQFGHEYRAAEGRLMALVVEAFELYPRIEPVIVREVDRIMLNTEARDLMSNDGPPWYADAGVLTNRIVPVPTDVARKSFEQHWLWLASRAGTRPLQAIGVTSLA